MCKIGGLLWVINDHYKDYLLIGLDEVIDKRNGIKGLAGISQMGSYFWKFFSDVNMIESKDDNIHNCFRRIVMKSIEYHINRYERVP